HLPHVPQVPGGPALLVGELALEVSRETLQDAGAPRLALAPVQEVLADRPVQAKDLGVGGARGAEPCGADAGLELGQEFGVVGRLEVLGHRPILSRWRSPAEPWGPVSSGIVDDAGPAPLLLGRVA